MNVLSIALLCAIAALVVEGVPSDSRIRALFVIGDSGLDAGQNNYIPESKITANVQPYGRTYFHVPTGRWTDGRMLADFLAQSLGLPLIPPYLQPGANFSYGANFASAGAGLADTVNAGNGIVNMGTQLRQFANLTSTYRKEMGEAGASSFLENSVCLFGLGSNDIAIYINNPDIPPNALIPRMVEDYQQALLTLYNEGIRKFVLVGLLPLGCTPNAKYTALTSSVRIPLDGCIDLPNEFITGFNTELRGIVNNFAIQLPGASVILVKPYDLTLRAIRTPFRYGFANSRDACCGGGPFNAGDFCGNADRHYGRVPGRYLDHICPFPSSYLFWDANHPTEATYYWWFRYFWYGDQRVAEPYSLRRMFISNSVPSPPTIPPPLFG